MPLVNAYATIPEFKDWYKSSGIDQDSLDDLNLERAINATSRGIDDYDQRHFYQVTGPRYFDACWVTDRRGWVQSIDLGAFGDLVSVTSVKTDDNSDGTYETTWAPADYQLLPLNPAAAPEPRPYREIRATGTRTFPEPATRIGLVEITGTWGWPAVPDKVKQACLIRSVAVFKRHEIPLGVLTPATGLGDFTVRISRYTDPDVADLLDPYQLGVVA